MNFTLSTSLLRLDKGAFEKKEEGELKDFLSGFAYFNKRGLK